MYSLLIVEDEALVRNYLLGVVEWAKANVLPAGAVSNGAEALAFIRSTPVDLVITDIRMPGMDGLELACELQAHHPGTKTVLYSAYNDFEFARRGIQY
ncbi:MAG: response regulator, partial [Clostridiales bacterium]|nr:response regulator [Clostridiales bacterium]